MSRSLAALALAAALVMVAGCAGASDEPSSDDPSFRVTVEEAGLLAKGHLFELYGEEAEPVVEEVLDTRRDELGGRPVWVLEARVEVTEDGRRVDRRWRFRVGLDDGRPAVLDAEWVDREERPP